MISLEARLSSFDPNEGLSMEPLEDDKKKRGRRAHKFSRSTTIAEVMSHMANYHKVGCKKSTLATALTCPSNEDDDTGDRDDRDYYGQDVDEFENDTRQRDLNDMQEEAIEGDDISEMGDMSNGDPTEVNAFFSRRDRLREDVYVSDNGFVLGDDDQPIPDIETDEEGEGVECAPFQNSDGDELDRLVRKNKGLAVRNRNENKRRASAQRQLTTDDLNLNADRFHASSMNLPSDSKSLMSDILTIPKNVDELANSVRFYLGLDFFLESFKFSKTKNTAKISLLNMAKLLRLSIDDVNAIRDSLVYPITCFEPGTTISNPFVKTAIDILEKHNVRDTDIDLIRRQLLLRLQSMDYSLLVEKTQDKKLTRINFHWNIVYEVQNLHVHKLRLQTFNIPPKYVTDFRNSRRFSDKATQHSDKSKSNVEVLMEAAKVLYPRGTSFLSDEDKGSHQMIKFPVLGQLMVTLSSLSRTLLKEQSSKGAWDVSLIRRLFQNPHYSKYMLDMCLQHITSPDDERRNPTWRNLARDFRFVRNHSKFKALHLNSSILDNGDHWICQWNPFESRFGVNGTLVEWLQTTCAQLGVRQKPEFWQMFLVVMAGLSPNLREYLLLYSPPGAGKSYTAVLMYKLLCFLVSGKEEHGLIQMGDTYTASSLRATPAEHPLQNCKGTRLMNEWSIPVPLKKNGSTSSGGDGEKHPVVANLKKIMDDGVLWVSRGTVNRADQNKVQENQTMIVRDHSLITFSKSIPASIIPGALLDRFITQNVRINERENENTPTMFEQEVDDNIKTFDIKERLKLLLSVACFCMQLEHVGQVSQTVK